MKAGGWREPRSSGDELFQFGQALPLGDGRFRLSRLLRRPRWNRMGNSGHAAGEVFCLLSSPTLQPLSLPTWAIGATINAAANGGAGFSTLFGGENVRPLSPVNLSAKLLSGAILSSPGPGEAGWALPGSTA